MWDLDLGVWIKIKILTTIALDPMTNLSVLIYEMGILLKAPIKKGL